MTAFIGSRRSKRRAPFLGWRIAWAALAIQAMIAGLFLQAYGVYAALWMTEFGWSRTTISLLYSLHRTESGLLGPFHGWLLHRVSPRHLVLIGVLALGGGFVLLPVVDGFLLFLAVFMIMAVGASFAGILSLTTVLVNWFDKYRARAMAMMATGLSVGGLAVPLVGAAMEAFGWRAVAFGSGIVVLAVGVPLSRLMHPNPEDLGLLPDGEATPHDANVVRPRATSWTVGKALASRAFWQISIGHATAMTIVSAMLVHFVVYAQQTLGVSVTVAASVLTVATVCARGGQVLGGWFGDRHPKRHLAALGMLGHAVAMTLLAVASDLVVVVIAALLHGVAWGLRGPLMGAMRADYFGRGAFAMVMGVSSLIVMVGSIGGPLLMGVIADATDSYRSGYLTLAGVALLGAATFFTLAPPRAFHAPTTPSLEVSP